MNKPYLLVCFVLTVFMASCQSDLRSDSVKLSPEVFKDSLNSIDIQVVDVRTLEEFNKGHINNALLINFHSKKFADSVGLLNTKKPVFIYCRSGKRSAKSISVFKELGFKTVYELEGGIINWRKEGFKITDE